MDRYSLESWTLERHAEMVRTAEDRARLRDWRPRPTLSRRLAGHLRLLADRLDGRPTFNVISGSQ